MLGFVLVLYSCRRDYVCDCSVYSKSGTLIIQVEAQIRARSFEKEKMCAQIQRKLNDIYRYAEPTVTCVIR